MWLDHRKPVTNFSSPYKFTGKQLDEESGLYYFGARYLDPKYSRWMSTDPALGEYIPAAGKGTAEESGKLPGMGGVYNHINGNLYHYAGNNPVKYTDPDGNQMAIPSPVGVIPIPIPVIPISAPNNNRQKVLGDEFIPPTGLGNSRTEFPSFPSFSRLKRTIIVALAFKILNTFANTSDIPSQGEVDGGVEGAPPVDAGKQGKHVSGHPNNVPGKSQWKDGTSGIPETQQGWNEGTTLPDGTKVWDSGKELGQNGETGVRVHQDKKGRIHGYPVNPKQYLGD